MNPTEFDTWLRDRSRPPLVMGVLNVTPDSFSDGGQNDDPAAAVARVRQMVAEGASLVDIGAESTRPGSQPVAPNEQIRRLKPLLSRISADRPDVIFSIDTTSAQVAEFAVSYGINLINDVSAGRDDPAIFAVAARHGAAVCLMHMRGTPATMQDNPTYDNVVSEVKLFLSDRMRAAESAGVAPERVLVDPGIGFGKTIEHNLLLLKHLRDIGAVGRPVLVGTSRKGFIGRITGVADPAQRQAGTAATVAWSVWQGAGVVRVHDVAEAVQVVRMTRAMMTGHPAPG